MRTGDLLDLYRFDDWANGRLVSATAALPVETARRGVEGSFRSIRDLLAHLVSTEWVWLERSGGSSPSAIPGWVESDDVASL